MKERDDVIKKLDNFLRHYIDDNSNRVKMYTLLTPNLFTSHYTVLGVRIFYRFGPKLGTDCLQFQR